MDVDFYQSVLRNAGVLFDAGLTDDEVDAIERRFRFAFPPDLRAFLSAALPVSNGFVDWRHASDDQIQSRLDWPLDGLSFDIEVNAFWLADWGTRPAALADAIAVARSAVSAAPRLIPILLHRYIPDRPSEAANPVFSVHQSDIIYYGADLAQYLENEFPADFGTPRYQLREGIRRIDLWSRLAEANDGAI